jgi:hypothetical protein
MAARSSGVVPDLGVSPGEIDSLAILNGHLGQRIAGTRRRCSSQMSPRQQTSGFTDDEAEQEQGDWSFND